MKELRELLGPSLQRLRIRGFNEKCINSPADGEPLRVWLNMDSSRALGVDGATEKSADFFERYTAQFQQWLDAALEAIGEELDHISFSPEGGETLRPMASANLTFRQGRVIDEISYFAEETETAKQ